MCNVNRKVSQLYTSRPSTARCAWLGWWSRREPTCDVFIIVVAMCVMWTERFHGSTHLGQVRHGARGSGDDQEGSRRKCCWQEWTDTTACRLTLQSPIHGHSAPHQQGQSTQHRKGNYTVSQKNWTLWLIWHNFTSSQHLLITGSIQFSVDCNEAIAILIVWQR